MANPDTPCGARIFDTCLRLRPYDAQAYNASSALAIYFNDVVLMANDGYIDPQGGNSTSTAIVGVAQTLRLSDDSSAKKIIVADHPNQLFIIQDDASATSSITHQFNNCDILTTAGSSTTNVAAGEINITNVVTNAAAQMRIMYLHDHPGNAWGSNADLVCEIYEHVHGTSGGTVAI